ncbi:zinc knuckle CX2CX4HX4C containing protein [Tanacetum coccineum]
MMNSKGFFFFKFESQAGLEAVLEGGPWLICKAPIILKKWSTDTKLLKEELTRIPIWVKLHDVPLQVFKEDGIILIASFIGKPVMLIPIKAPCVMTRREGVEDFQPKTNSREKVVSPPIVATPNVVNTSTVVTPTVENDGFQAVGKKKKKGDITTSSNSFSCLNVEDEEEEEEVEKNL